jgi:hypothetical protein
VLLLLDGASRSPLQGAVVEVSGLDHLGYDDVEFFAEVHRIVTEQIELAGGSVPAVGSAAWRSAPPAAKVARLLVLTEAYLIKDSDAAGAALAGR